MAQARPHRAELQPIIASVQLFRVAWDGLHRHRRVAPDRFEQRRVLPPTASEFSSNLRRRQGENGLRAAKSEARETERAPLRSFASAFATRPSAARSLLFEVRSAPRSADAAPSADSFEAPSPAPIATR